MTRNDYATMADEGSNPKGFAPQIEYLPVAQLDSASDSDSEGQRFESARAGQENTSLSNDEDVFFIPFDLMKERVKKEL